MLQEWWTPAALLLLAALIGVVVERVAIRRLVRFTDRTASHLDDAALGALRLSLTFWFVLGGIVAAAQYAPLESAHRALVVRLAGISFLISVTLSLARFADLWLRGRERAEGVAWSGVARPSLIRYIVRAVILTGGAMLVLDNLGLEITALLTALGVGSIAVALAMQPTLSNLFAGVHLSLARPIHVGDFIELEDGTQGYVVDIGWRATSIRQLSNNLVIVPNAKLAEMVIRNYALPEHEQSVVVPMGVAYGADLARVEAITIEVAREVQRETPGAVAEFEPFIRYDTFADSAVQFNTILRARSFVDRYLLIHEFHKRIHARFEHEGVEIPFPQRVVHWANGHRPGENAGAQLLPGRTE